MNAKEYNDFLKRRRTSKVFEEFEIPASDRQMLIDAVNFAPAQNSNRNFIPLLVEKKAHKEWLQDNIFYMVPKYSDRLGKVMPIEYQLGVLTSSLTVIYLEANKNFPIVNHPSHLDQNGEYMKEPDIGDICIRNINIGINMAFVANQAYLLGYDVGFNGCTRGLRNVFNTPELKEQLLDIYKEFDIMDLYKKHGLTPSYAVCIGKAIPVISTRLTDADIEGIPYKDGYYTNIRKHQLNAIESIRILNE